MKRAQRLRWSIAGDLLVAGFYSLPKVPRMLVNTPVALVRTPGFLRHEYQQWHSRRKARRGSSW